MYLGGFLPGNLCKEVEYSWLCEITDLQNFALGLGKEILAYEKLSYKELSSKIDEMEKVIELMAYDGHIRAKRLLVQQIIHHCRSHIVPAVAQAMSLVFRSGHIQLRPFEEQLRNMFLLLFGLVEQTRAWRWPCRQSLLSWSKVNRVARKYKPF